MSVVLRRHVCSVGILLSMSASLALGALAQQPADKHSFLIQNNGKGIRDDDFAAIMKQYLVKNGQPNVEGAKFLFQQCYGGGMLDDLTASLGNTVKWVGGSASQWDTQSFGELTNAENLAKPPAQRTVAPYIAAVPEDYWTRALLPELPKNQTLLQSIDNAGTKDQVGPNATPQFGHWETPQSTFGGGGDTLKLKEGAQSYHAILWAGSPDALRHYNDIENMRNALITAWGNPDIGPGNVTIDVFFGDGLHKPDGTDLPTSWHAMAATRTQLDFVMSNLPLNENEEFLFYASDHGGASTTIQEKAPIVPPKPVLPKLKDFEPFQLAQGELDAMIADASNIPTLTVDYQGLLGPVDAAVYFNNAFLGYLNPSLTEMEFSLPESILSLSNLVEIDNNGLTSFDITGKWFFTGGISTNPPIVPEPAGLALLAAIGALTFRRPSRRSALHARTSPQY